jgi:hypothetical protein
MVPSSSSDFRTCARVFAVIFAKILHGDPGTYMNYSLLSFLPGGQPSICHLISKMRYQKSQRRIGNSSLHLLFSTTSSLHLLYSGVYHFKKPVVRGHTEGETLKKKSVVRGHTEGETLTKKSVVRGHTEGETLTKKSWRIPREKMLEQTNSKNVRWNPHQI